MLAFWFIVGAFFLYSMIKTSLDNIDGDQTVHANYEKPNFVHERNELTDAEGKKFKFRNLTFPLEDYGRFPEISQNLT